MKVCSKDYKLTFSPDETGGSFSTVGLDNEGMGEVNIGLHYPDLRGVVEILVHELVELIMVEDNKRWHHCTYVDDSTRKIFLFDHDYLDSYAPKLLEALLTSGFFKLIDARPKKKGKKK